MKLSYCVTYVFCVLWVPQVLSQGDTRAFCNSPGAGNETDKSVPDCNCKFHSVDYAVKHFISPLLRNLTTKTFFRYFKVDLESPCPYWPAVGQCMMEGCSVCTCDEDEIPKPWLEHKSKKPKKSEYGWITSPASEYGFEGQGHDDSLGRISVAEGEASNMQLDGMYNDSQQRDVDVVEVEFGDAGGIQNDPEEDTDDSDDWVVCNGAGRKEVSPHTNLPAFAASYGYNALFDPVETAEEVVKDAAYVNLLENPERFTGYSGPSAQRVWRAIQEENCFGEQNDVCLEKRVFYRLMSGLQASISTHIARNYLHPDGQWGTNHPLYWRAVGSHPDRLNNMYFSFLFLLRAVVRAQETLRTYAYNTGHSADDLAVSELLNKLLESSAATSVAPFFGADQLSTDSASTGHGHGQVRVDAAHKAENSLKELLRASVGEGADSKDGGSYDPMAAVEECRYGFNESELFQVSEAQRGPQYWNTLQDKQELRDEFMTKFRNISRIMDCVTCEKCRVWGKLQILGFGTAIKILLHPADKIVTQTATVSTKDADTAHSSVSPAATCDVLGTKQRPRLSLNRQEIIALVNTLNQFSNSLIFAAEAAEQAGRADIPEQPVLFASVLAGAADAVTAAVGTATGAEIGGGAKSAGAGNVKAEPSWLHHFGQLLLKFCPTAMSGVAIVLVLRKKLQREKEARMAKQQLRREREQQQQQQ